MKSNGFGKSTWRRHLEQAWQSADEDDAEEIAAAAKAAERAAKKKAEYDAWEAEEERKAEEAAAAEEAAPPELPALSPTAHDADMRCQHACACKDIQLGIRHVASCVALRALCLVGSSLEAYLDCFICIFNCLCQFCSVAALYASALSADVCSRHTSDDTAQRTASIIRQADIFALTDNDAVLEAVQVSEHWASAATKPGIKNKQQPEVQPQAAGEESGDPEEKHAQVGARVLASATGLPQREAHKVQ